MKLNRNQLIDKAIKSGWQYDSYNNCNLWREVPYKTRQTGYTWMSHNNDTATEFVSIGNLQYCGKNSRVWKQINSK